MIYEITIPQFIKSLENLSTILDKAVQYADHKKVEGEVILQSRLAVDQLPLVRQIQIACDTAKLAASRLTGKEAPSNPDTEKTFPEIKERIAGTVKYLKSFKASDFAESAQKHITTPRWDGKYLTGEEFVLHHALPNIYFHVTTAYSILRHLGLDIGKKDYLGAIPYKT